MRLLLALLACRVACSVRFSAVPGDDDIVVAAAAANGPTGLFGVMVADTAGAVGQAGVIDGVAGERVTVTLTDLGSTSST